MPTAGLPSSNTEDENSACRVGGLFRYPIKSCRGEALEHARFDVQGIEHDREWQIVDTEGRFVTQRELPRMACVVPSLDRDCLRLSAPLLNASSNGLTIGLDDFSGPRREVSCWNWRGPAIDQGDDAADWLSAVLGQALRLVRFAPEQRRLCNSTWAGDSGAHTRFSDGYPVLVLSQDSVDDLSARLTRNGRLKDSETLAIERFRPNLVLHGLSAYEEDYLEMLSTATVSLRLVKPCPRCVIPSIDPLLGVVTSVDPLAELSSYRLNPSLGGAMFGMNAVVEAGVGAQLSVGQPLEATYRFD